MAVSLTIRDFTFLALKDEGADDRDIPRRIQRAIRYYLADRGSGRPDWGYPGVIATPSEAGEEKLVTVSTKLDRGVWDALLAEAERQGVEPERLVDHAAIYFAADRDAGRVTSRILDAIDAEES